MNFPAPCLNTSAIRTSSRYIQPALSRLTRKVHAETRRHSLRRSGSSSQPLACDFLPDQARDDLAFGLLGRFQDLELLGRQMTLDCFLHESAQVVRLDGVKLDRNVSEVLCSRVAGLGRPRR